MRSRDFCYWLQGFFELAKNSDTAGAADISRQQAGMIQQHLAMVFKHEIDPEMGGPEKQKALNSLHSTLDDKMTNGPASGPLMRC